MKVIALTGRAGSGKDTVGQLLQFLTDKNCHDIGSFTSPEEVLWNGMFNAGNSFCTYHIAKFAYPVYQIAAILVGRPVEELYLDPCFKSGPQWGSLTGRELLQKIGTDCFRDVLGTDVWADIMNDHLMKLDKQNVEGVIITDTRFLNEGELIRRWNGTIIRLRGRDAGVDTTHQSESELEQIVADIELDNSNDYRTLGNALTSFCEVHNILNNKYVNWHGASNAKTTIESGTTKSTRQGS